MPSFYFYLHFKTFWCMICFYRTGGKDNFFHCNKCGEFTQFRIKFKLWLSKFCDFLSKWVLVFTFSVLHGVGCCYSNLIKDAHHCIERAMHHNCPVCFEVNWKHQKTMENNKKNIQVLTSFWNSICSFCLIQSMISLFYIADILYIWNASKRCSLTTSILALFAQNPSVICQSSGKNLMKRYEPS